MTAEELDAAVDRITRETRAEQGLPPTVEDPVALDRIAGLMTTEPAQPAPAKADDERQAS